MYQAKECICNNCFQNDWECKCYDEQAYYEENYYLEE